ncbi:MAG: hypothetical protein AAFR30_12005 [Cyanobacteria bacterium J06628_4]
MAVSQPTLSKTKNTDGSAPWLNENVKAFGLFVISLVLFLLFWEVGAYL